MNGFHFTFPHFPICFRIPFLLQHVVTYLNVYRRLEGIVWRKMGLFSWIDKIWFFLYPMDTSSLIRHWSDVEIPHGKFVEISSILKGESTWKLWHRFDVEISTQIQISKSTKYRQTLHVDFSVSFPCWIYITALLSVSILSFSNIFCSGNLF